MEELWIIYYWGKKNISPGFGYIGLLLDIDNN